MQLEKALALVVHWFKGLAQIFDNIKYAINCPAEDQYQTLQCISSNFVVSN